MARLLVHRGGGRFEALQHQDDDPTRFERKDLNVAQAIRYRDEGGFQVVDASDFDNQLRTVLDATRKARRSAMPTEAVLRRTNPDGSAYEALEYSKADPRQATRTPVSPQDLERWREGGGFDEVSERDWRQHLNRTRGVEEAESHLRVAPDFALDEEVPGVRENIAPVLDVRASESTTAERPARDEEYARAVAESDTQAMYRDLRQAGTDFRKQFLGLPADPSRFKEDPETNPVKRLLAQREMDRKARLSDPSSPESKRLQAAVASAMPGAYTPQQLATIAAEDADYVTDFVRVRSAAEGRAAAAKEAARRAEEDRTSREKQAGLDREAQIRAAGIGAAGRRSEAEADRALKIQLAAMEAAAKAGGKIVTSSDAGDIGQADSAIMALDDLDAAFAPSGADGLGGKLQAMLPWDSDPKRFDDKVLATAQSVGTFLERGKLAAGDEVKYRKLLPAPGDSVGRAKAKIENVKKLVRDEQQARIRGLGNAGYNVNGFQQGGGSPAPAPAPTGAPTAPQPATQAGPLPPPAILKNGKRALRMTRSDGSIWEETDNDGAKRIR